MLTLSLKCQNLKFIAKKRRRNEYIVPVKSQKHLSFEPLCVKYERHLVDQYFFLFVQKYKQRVKESLITDKNPSKGRSSIVSYCNRSTKQLFCICLVVYCFKVASHRAASSSYLSTHKIKGHSVNSGRNFYQDFFQISI